MTALELVNKYHIILVHEMFNKKTRRYEKVENVVEVLNIDLAKEDDVISELKARKAEIIDAIKAQAAAKKAAEEDRKNRIKAIEGLAEIKAAQSRIFARSMKIDEVMNGDGDFSFVDTTKEEYDFEAAYRKYPKAAAYLKAEALSENRDEKLAEVGKKALDEILYGDWEKAVEMMNSEKNERNEEVEIENVCYSAMRAVENNLMTASEFARSNSQKARKAFSNAIECVKTLKKASSSALATEKQHNQFNYALQQLRSFLESFESKTEENVDDLATEIEQLNK